MARKRVQLADDANDAAFSADLMEIPEPEILRARCVMTVIGCEVVWEEK